MRKRYSDSGKQILTCNNSWLYTLFLSLDGNFRVKLKDRKLPDIPLTRDLAYFVDQDRYLDYVKLHKGEEYVRKNLILSLLIHSIMINNR
jgi:hypothetical protein